MPSDPLETLFCCRGEAKTPSESKFISSSHPMIEDPDLPPESFRLPIHGDLRWVQLTRVLDRGQSTIGSANPKSIRSCSKPKSHLPIRPNPGGSIKPPNGPIPGLPNSAFHGNGSRPIPTYRIFPLNFSLERKPAVLDPGSPKVSCFGSVLSDSEREKKIGERGSVVADEAEVVKGVGCWANLAAILGFAGVYPAASGELEDCVSRSSKFSSEEERKTIDSTAPELQGMKRFTARRRWLDDVDVSDGGHVVSLEPLDRERMLPRS
ncbi:uncharacterized protein LOC110035432 [Phalaenopsis equestris]|uniref:uncharacterized protein LOC110035432 n=1 Tax=Phalaenopsis equestris TaxID=78828 RepID=UPI0009E1E743|nr:uncharacterized protein LOC110035432 [Phalaenopsis equestris]